MMQLKAKSATVIKISDTLYQLRFQIPEEEVKIKLYYKIYPLTSSQRALSTWKCPT